MGEHLVAAGSIEMQLLDEKSLAEQQVERGDVLRIQPEITAGR
ncbi:MAG: hypothetical protein ACYTF8_18365 [Planctomycetota bacterium]